MAKKSSYGTVVISLPRPILNRLDKVAPKAGDRSYLLREWIIEGLNRFELDCLFCSLKERKRTDASKDSS